MFKQLNKWNKKTEEERSYRGLFLILIFFLILITLWTLWDETIKRRPWKVYQRQFFKVEKEIFKKQYEALKSNIASPENQAKIKEIYAKIDQLKQGPKDFGKRKIYLEAKETLTRLQKELKAKAREYSFEKSRFDAAYYKYEKALLHHSGNLSEEKAKVNKRQENLDRYSVQIKEIESQMKLYWEITTPHDDALRALENQLSAMNFDLDTMGRKLSNISKKGAKIHQILLLDTLDRVDRCMTCHAGIERKEFDDPSIPQPFRAHPQMNLILKNHPAEKFGCTICHQGQGPALDVKRAHGEVKHWGEPLLRGKKIQASCIKCHSESPLLEGAKDLTQGNLLIEKLGCFGCHLMPGLENREKRGPSLSRISEKTSIAWMEQWIKDPQYFDPTTRMPQFKVTDLESKAIAHFLFSLNQEAREKKNDITGDTDKGEKLFKDLACVACHQIEGKGNTFAPALTNVGSKVKIDWLIQWLKDPNHYLANSKMPSMRLSDDEVEDLSAYLLTLKKEGFESGLKTQFSSELAKEGKKLVQTLGCYGCHDIKGMEKMPRVGADLLTFGEKDLDLMFFGHAKNVKHDWWDWTFHKLKDPQSYATDRIEQKMPNFHLSDKEIQSILLVLAGFRSDNRLIPEEFKKHLSAHEKTIDQGRTRVRDFNCTGCHQIEKEGAGFAPSLEGEGAKVRPQWFYQYVNNSISIRPWLNIRMPRFNLNPDESAQLAAYFAALDNVSFPFETEVQEVNASDRDVKVGEKLFTMLRCLSCHSAGRGAEPSQGNQGSLGPDLSLANDRLRHDWIARWILEPQNIQPGTMMPTNFPVIAGARISFVPKMLQAPAYQKDQEALKEILGEDYDKFLNDINWQVKAIRDYMLILGDPGTEIKTEVIPTEGITPPQNLSESEDDEAEFDQDEEW